VLDVPPEDEHVTNIRQFTMRDLDRLREFFQTEFAEYEKARWSVLQSEPGMVVDERWTEFSYTQQEHEFEEESSVDEHLALDEADAAGRRTDKMRDALQRYEDDCNVFLRKRCVELGLGDNIAYGLSSADIDEAEEFRIGMYNALVREIRETVTLANREPHVVERVREVQSHVVGIASRLGMLRGRITTETAYPRDRRARLGDDGGHREITELNADSDTVVGRAMRLAERYAILDINAWQEPLAAAVLDVAFYLQHGKRIPTTWHEQGFTQLGKGKAPAETRQRGLTKFANYFENIRLVETQLRELLEGRTAASAPHPFERLPWRESGLDPALRGLGTRRGRRP